MLYLIDKPMAEIGLRTAAGDPEAHVVLIQDGVYLSPDIDAPVSAVARDVDVRGSTSRRTSTPYPTTT